MSQASVRLRDPVDLEEFERKLRSAAPDPKQGGDPLQELSRLIGVQQDQLDQLFAAETKPASPAPMHSATPAAPMASKARINVAHFDERLFRPAEAKQKTPIEDPADISALLNQFPDAAARFAAAKPASDMPAPNADHRYDAPPPFAPDYGDPAMDEPGYRADYNQAEPPKSRRPLLLMGAALVVLIGGVGAVLVSRSGAGPAGGTPTIQASNTPVKVASAPPVAPEQAQQGVSVLDKANTERLAASRVVNREEQPVDIRAQARANRPETTGVIATPSVPSAGSTNGNGLFPDPRPVKTVSVRPDGSVIDPGSARTPTAPVASVTPSMANNPPPAPVARPTATAPAATKTTARATPPTTVAERPAASEPATQKPAAERTATPAGAGGDYSVQLAAPGSEAEARSVMTRLTQRFGAELGGRKLSFRKAAVGDKSVYRVRVSGLSQENAASLCTKLQAKGGNCFVARN